MELLSIFNFPIYSFQASEHFTDKVLSDVKSLKWKKNMYNEVTEGDYYNKNLIDWFDICIEEIKKANAISADIKLPVTACWANKTTLLMKHHQHNHPNSFLSGIFYLTDNTGSETVFTLENPLYKQFSGLNIGDHLISRVKPQKGNLIIFPSYLTHSVNTLKEHEVRYTVAFNVFLGGTFGTKTTTQLTFKTLSLHEKYEA